MSVVVIGLNHRTVPLELLERVTVAPDDLPKALHDLGTRPNVSEAVVLSTCNRTEVYVVAERFHGAYQDVRDFLAEHAHLAPEEFNHHLYSHFDDTAVEHLFRVAAGLDSAVLGESEILGQVRGAWERAQAEGSSRASLNLLFRHAIEAGKRARTDTGIGRSTASVSSAAVAMATERLGSLRGRSVLLVGAGEMGEGLAIALIGAGASATTVTNRTLGRALELSERIGGRAAPFDDLAGQVAAADVVLTCTGAGTVVLDHDTVEAAMAGRADRPLLVVDIAVPRDVEASVGTIASVTRLDLDDLKAFAARGLAERQVEAMRARELVADEVHRYLELATARQAAPLVAQLHEQADQVRQAELARFRSRLDGLDDRQRDAVVALTRGLVAKLLHEPTIRLKGAAGSPRGERLAEAVRDLFDLS